MSNSVEIIYNAASYSRISNDDGDLAVQGKEESNSISNQRSLIEDFAKDRPDIILCKEWVDDGFSGVNFERPAFKQMIDAVKAGEINCIIVKDLSRFGRNYIEVGRFIQKIFPYLGVRFISINDNYDSNTSSSTETHIMLPFKNLMNDSYSRDLSVKVRSQFEIKRKRGEFIGSFAVYGYMKDPDNKNHLIIDDYAATIVQDIFRWKLEGKSNEKIADKLNRMGVLSPSEYKKSKGHKYNTGFGSGRKSRWSANAIRRILTDQTYLGYVVQGKKTTPNHKVKKIIKKKPDEWVVVKDMHEPIIDQETFLSVQKVLQMDTRVSPQKEEVYLYSGVVFCGDCGGNMVRKIVSAGKNAKGDVRKYPYFTCSSYKKDIHCCGSHLFKESALEEAVLITLKKHIDNLFDLKVILETLNQEPTFNLESRKLDIQLLKVNEEAIKIQNLKVGLYEDLTNEIISSKEYFELKEHYSELLNQCERQILNLKEEQERVNNLKYQKNEWIDIFLEHKNIVTLNRTIVLKLIDKVEIYENGRIKITFNFQYDYDLALKAIHLYKAGEGISYGKEKQKNI